MKKRGIAISALAITAAFVVTVIVFAAGIYSDYKSGLETASTKFEKLSSRTAEASGIYPSGSKEFVSLFNSAVGSPDIYESVKLLVDGNDVYIYPDTKVPSTSAFVKSFSTRITGGDGANIQLNAEIFTVTPSMIFYRAKIAFIIVLAGTLAACILLMYLYLSGAEKKPAEEEVFKKTDFDDDFGQSLFDEDENPAKEEITAKESPSENAGAEKIPADDNTLPEGAYIKENDSRDENVDFNPLENAFADHEKTSLAAESAGNGPDTDEIEIERDTGSEEETQPAVAGAAEDLSPSAEGAITIPAAPENAGTESNSADEPAYVEQGLFSPSSGFGWESYLATRLESELVRAASSEQDLSLVIIRIPSMTKESACYKDICKVLLDFFQFKDFIFEYKQDGFAAIIQNKNVDQAMESAELLYTDIMSVLDTADCGTKPLMGISSRSLRLISAGRLKTEAEQALLHAGDDSDSPIIAFRVNPEKYRKFISEQE